MYLYDRAYECVCGCMNVPRIGKYTAKSVVPHNFIMCRRVAGAEIETDRHRNKRMRMKSDRQRHELREKETDRQRRSDPERQKESDKH